MKKLVLAMSLILVFLQVSSARDYGDRVVRPLGSRDHSKYLVRGPARNACDKGTGYGGFHRNLDNFHKTLVMGSNDRKELTGDEKLISEYKQVGLVRGKDVGLSTGLVTGENCDVVITAGQSVVNEDAGRYKSKASDKSYWFHRNAATAKQFKLTMKVVATGFGEGSSKPQSRETDENDWAILRLDKPAYSNCKNISFSSFEQVDPSCFEAGRIVSVGTHKGSYMSKKINRNCRSYNLDPDAYDRIQNRSVILHDCDTEKYASGSPIYCRAANGQLTLIGVHTGSVTSVLSQKEIDSLHERYGQSGPEADPKLHINLAVPIWGEFERALKGELKESANRASYRDSI